VSRRENTVTLRLPYPPSVNHYWYRRRGGGVFVSDEGRAFRAAAILTAPVRPPAPFYDERLAVELLAHAPDARKRDLDNILKAALDALQAGAWYLNDEQIDDLRVRRGGIDPEGAGWIDVTIAIFKRSEGGRKQVRKRSKNFSKKGREPLRVPPP